MEVLLTFVAGVVLGALSSWFIAHRYYLKASADQKADLQRLSDELRPQNTVQRFEHRLKTSRWQKTFINSVEVWVCEDDNTFQIQQGERSREFAELWTTVYPDRTGFAYPVYLKIGDLIIRELTFISIDGARIFVPMAEARPTDGGGVEYFWNLNSLAVKVCRIIGSFYIYNNLEGVARRSGVAVIE